MAFRRTWTRLLPRGSVGNQFIQLLPPNCSFCDERARAQRPEIERYANKWLKKKGIKPSTESARAAAYGEPAAKFKPGYKRKAVGEERVRQLLVQKKKKKKEVIVEPEESEATTDYRGVRGSSK